MEKKYLLPQLKNKEAVVTNDCWENKQNIYNYLLDNLKLYYEPKSSIFDGGFSAYPHIFEQMLLFHKAFLDEKNHDHKRAVLEWRACLAIMALQRIKNVKLDMVKVDFENTTNIFLKAAASFRPEETPAFYLTTWDYTYVLCMDNEPIAILSPITLICPAKEFVKRIDKLHYWINIEKQNGEETLSFIFNGKGNEYSGLGYWLRELEKQLERNPDKNNVKNNYDQVVKKLGDYIKWVEERGTASANLDKKDNIYYSMNSSSRKEYSFFNFCCDFHITNPSLEFLKNSYISDIFQDKLLVIVYDERPDAMYKAENVEKMDMLFQQIPQINGKNIIAVKGQGGDRLPIYAFLPFKDSFVETLTQYKILPEEMLEKCEIEYIKSFDVIKITIQICEFPYSFEKIYEKKHWKILYGTKLSNVYVWPEFQINEDSWKAYYTFMYGSQNIDVSVLNSESSIIRKSSNLYEKNMYVCHAEHFPSYIRYEFESVSGYCPVRANNQEHNQAGKTAVVFIHIGHAMTYVKIVGENGKDGDGEHIKFQKPKSLRIVGDEKYQKDVCGYFVFPENTIKSGHTEEHVYFKNMFNSFWKYNGGQQNMEVRPMQDGQMLFDHFIANGNGSNNIVSFFYFEYYLMNEENRRNVHLFLEEILLYSARQVICMGYTYMKVKYLHCMEDIEEKLGQLDGLWYNAFRWVKKWTGIEGNITEALGRMDEQEALSWLLYKHMNKECSSGKENDGSEDLYIGVDIGWSKTLVCMLKSNPLKSFWTQIDFAGRHISMLDGDIPLLRYPEMLNILLRGSAQIGNSSSDDKLLHEFGNLYSSPTKTKEYYLGLFDVIAIRIEEESYRIPPDVYNRKQEFKAFLEVMTYNIFLLFLNVGYMIGKMYNSSKSDDEERNPLKVHLCLSGNGSKFLRWVANTKHLDEVNSSNEKEFFICKTEKGLLDIIKEGFEISNHDTDSNPKIESVEIKFLDEKEQLIDGYIFKEFSNSIMKEIEPVKHENMIENGKLKNFLKTIADIKKGFEEAFFKDYTNGSNNNTNAIAEVIKNEAESTGKQLAEAIEKMGDK